MTVEMSRAIYEARKGCEELLLINTLADTSPQMSRFFRGVVFQIMDEGLGSFYKLPEPIVEDDGGILSIEDAIQTTQLVEAIQK